MGLRYDEIKKLQVDQVTVDCGEVSLNITEAIKNSTAQRNYRLHEWPKTSELFHSVYMDLKTAPLSWLITRGSATGPFFCDVKPTRAGGVLETSKYWPISSFTNFFRGRLQQKGVGSEDVHMFSGHSLKRGSVKLYRSLGYRDEYIMDLVPMTGPNAYFSYCSAYNSCAPTELPRFTGRKDFLAHAEYLSQESEGLNNEETYEDFVMRYS